MDKKTPAVAKRSGADNNHIHNKNCISPQRKKQPISFAEINACAIPVLPDLLRRWLPGGVMRGAEYVVRNPKRADTRLGSFSINTRTGRWGDFAAGDKGGDVISLAAYLFNLSQLEALNKIAKMMGVRHD